MYSPAVPEPAILTAVLEPAVDVPAHRRSSPTVPVPALLTAVPEPAVDAPARPVDAAVPIPALSPAVPEPATYGVYPLIILIVYVIVTGGILCSDESEVYSLLTMSPVPRPTSIPSGTLVHPAV